MINESTDLVIEYTKIIRSIKNGKYPRTPNRVSHCVNRTQHREIIGDTTHPSTKIGAIINVVLIDHLIGILAIGEIIDTKIINPPIGVATIGVRIN